MKTYSSVIKFVICGALVCCTFSLSQNVSYGQGRTLSVQQLDTVVKPTLSQCSAPANQVKNARLDSNSIIPTANAREFSIARVMKTMHGMWRGEVEGSPLDAKNKEANVDYFWIMDTDRGEGLLIALRNGNNSTAGLTAMANPPQLSYLICSHDGYIPSMESGSQIHRFTKVANTTAGADKILTKATGVKFKPGQPLSSYWRTLVASGYFKSLPAVAFAGGFFKPLKFTRVISPIGPAQMTMEWDSEYYGGGTTGIQFTPGVPMKGVEYAQFVGTTASNGDFMVASPGNGRMAKVQARSGGNYDLAFDVASLGPLEGSAGAVKQPIRNHQIAKRKNNHSRRAH
jgi:hypothetical protein